MKLHTVFFTIMGFLIYKFFFGYTYQSTGPEHEDSATMLFMLWGGIFLCFLFGGIALALDNDKEDGVTETRDALMILIGGFITTHFIAIIGFIVALIFTIVNFK